MSYDGSHSFYSFVSDLQRQLSTEKVTILRHFNEDPFAQFSGPICMGVELERYQENFTSLCLHNKWIDHIESVELAQSRKLPRAVLNNDTSRNIQNDVFY